jgi:hypothetical protein
MGALSKNPLCPGKKAAVAPAILPANASAEPTPGSEEIAPGIPPIGAMSAVKGTLIAIGWVAIERGSLEEFKNFGMTDESTSEMEPLVSVT